MSADLVNLVFDSRYRPSDGVEDRLSEIERKASEGLRRIAEEKVLDDEAQCDVAMLLALQASRYPEHYERRLDIGKYLAIELRERRDPVGVHELNARLSKFGARLPADECESLARVSESELDSQLDHILTRHGYEVDFNVGIIINAVPRVAEHLLALNWTLLFVDQPSYILSDHPVPHIVGSGYRTALTGSIGLTLDTPRPGRDRSVTICAARAAHVRGINIEVRERAVEWICGPGLLTNNY